MALWSSVLSARRHLEWTSTCTTVRNPAWPSLWLFQEETGPPFLDGSNSYNTQGTLLDESIESPVVKTGAVCVIGTMRQYCAKLSVCRASCTLQFDSVVYWQWSQENYYTELYHNHPARMRKGSSNRFCLSSSVVCRRLSSTKIATLRDPGIRETLKPLDVSDPVKEMAFLVFKPLGNVRELCKSCISIDSAYQPHPLPKNLCTFWNAHAPTLQMLGIQRQFTNRAYLMASSISFNLMFILWMRVRGKIIGFVCRRRHENRHFERSRQLLLSHSMCLIRSKKWPSLSSNRLVMSMNHANRAFLLNQPINHTEKNMYLLKSGCSNASNAWHITAMSNSNRAYLIASS